MAKTTTKIMAAAAVLVVIMNPFAVHALTISDAPFVKYILSLTAPTAAQAFTGTLPVAEQREARLKTMRIVTAYSSTPDQCDSTPFTTANGTQVHDGIVAANWLKFGTRVRIPEMFGDKVFIVTDRMNTRFDDRLDIWMPDRDSAVQFGLRRLTVEVL